MNRASAIKVGLFVLVVLGASFWAIKAVYKGSGLRPKGYKLWGLFRDATGLVDKSRVQVAGLNVGSIVERELSPEHPNRAKVTILIADSNLPIYENAVLFKKSASLLGEFYLEIDPGTATRMEGGRIVENRRLTDGEPIPTVVEPATFADLQRQISDLMPTIQSILKDVKELTSGPIKEIAANVNRSILENSEALKKLLVDADKVAVDIGGVTERTREDLVATLKNIHDISDGLKSLIGSKAPTKDKAANAMEKIESASERLDHALAQVDEMVTRTNEGHGTIGRLTKDEKIADNVEGITEDVGGFIRSLTRLQTIVGLRSEYNVLASTFKTYVSIQIQPRLDKYYLVEFINDPRGVRHEEIEVSQTTDPTKPQSVSTQTIRVTDQFRFSFQFAKRALPYTTFRFGVKESTGGVGTDLDLNLLGRPLTLSIDLFDFRSNVYPRLKVLAALEFFRGLYFIGGIDDLINSRATVGSGGGRDYFIGAQLRFNDEDLRGLLLFGGGMVAGSAAK